MYCVNGLYVLVANSCSPKLQLTWFSWFTDNKVITAVLGMQVAGHKYVRLYSRQQTPMLYVDSKSDSSSAKSATRAQRNISAVNIEQPNLQQHPEFVAAQFTECVLAPGEMLFIPAKYWHYVRSLSSAVSVNFWY